MLKTENETDYDIEINLEINFNKRIEIFDEYDLIPCLFTCTDSKNNLFLNLLINEGKLEVKQKDKNREKDKDKNRNKDKEINPKQDQLINQEKVSKPNFNFYREYLCLRISEEKLVKAKNKLISLRDIFIDPEDKFILKVRLNEDFNVMKTEIIFDLNTIKNKDLPEENLFLLED